MPSKFAIREKGTNTFCTSQKHCYFSADLQDAALFASRENAEKAVRGMLPKAVVNPYGGYTWSIVSEDGRVVQAYHAAMLKEYIALLEMHEHCQDQAVYLKQHGVERAIDLEVVEIKLVLA